MCDAIASAAIRMDPAEDDEIEPQGRVPPREAEAMAMPYWIDAKRKEPVNVTGSSDTSSVRRY